MHAVLSFVLPTRNRPRELAATIDRLGSLPNLVEAEVIVVDNHSREPVTIPARLANGWRACSLRRPRNEGAAARNDGVRIASGQWIVMLDDDSHPIDLGVLESIADAPADVAAIGAEVLVPGGEHEEGGLPEVIVGCGAALRRDAFLAAGGYDPDFSFYVEEYDLCARLLLAGHRVMHDSRFRVLHTKTPGPRDLGIILGRLVRNHGWVLQRYAPARVLEDAMRETRERYESIARVSGVLEGYRAGYAELCSTTDRQPRRPMTDELWARFTGESIARAELAAQRTVIAERAVGIVRPGKAAPLVARLVEELGGRIVSPPEAETLVIGTLAPGPLRDAIAALGAETRPVLSPWSVAARTPCDAREEPLRRAG